MYNLAEACRLLATWLTPFIPATTEKMHSQLSCGGDDRDFDKRVSWGGVKPGTVIRKGDPLFPRLELPGEGPAAP